MQIEILKFLVQAQEHLRSGSDNGSASRPLSPDGDLQAVERALPDCDWFELEEVRERRQPPSLSWENPVLFADA